MAELPKITECFLPKTQYVDKEYTKSMIFMHHTASGGDPYGVLEYWKSNGERVGTAFLIARGTTSKYKDGEIIQCFSSSKAAWHLGLKKKDLIKGGKTSTELNLNSVGIEICNWGGLVVKNEKFITYDGEEVPADQVLTLDKTYRGFLHYQKYSEAQLDSARDLLRYLCEKYDIDKAYKGDQIFDIDPRCLKGERGIFTHTSCRTDKMDCFPQLELKQMLASL